jgi:polyisoprenoid-binding protein YceI
MKKLILFAVIAGSLVACNSQTASTEAEEAQEVAEATGSESYTVDAAASTVAWKASKITGAGHNGGIAITSGTINTENEAIVAGNFELDMNSITNEDVEDEGKKADLLGHLASADFFDVENNPTSKFEITAATADSLTGNLTIKGITKSITIPYTWSEDEAGAKATSSFSIDRSQWDVRYGSSSFFDDLGDKAINDAIEFNVSLALTK